MIIRPYKPGDYAQVISLYKQGDLYGGQFDPDRDSAVRLTSLVEKDPESVLVCESEGGVVGTISLIENGRVAWLFRFAVKSGADADKATKQLYESAVSILRLRGHKQVLVYSPAGDKNLDTRYQKLLSFTKGNDFTCFWKEI